MFEVKSEQKSRQRTKNLKGRWVGWAGLSLGTNNACGKCVVVGTQTGTGGVKLRFTFSAFEDAGTEDPVSSLFYAGCIRRCVSKSLRRDA